MPAKVPLSTIIALARAGALEHAWNQFEASGYSTCLDDPAALTVKGRLLKDRATRARGAGRQNFYRLSAAAYRRAAELQQGTYPLINAATLSLLSGQRDEAQEDARAVLERIAREPDEPETPYWRSATEAEALLLLGRGDEARVKLAAALAAAPRAWEDHASTLRQFILIGEETKVSLPWLDMLRPPRSLFYADDFSAGVPDPLERADGIAEFITSKRIGFGFGGLAAGREIVIAEALLSSSAELHVTLPTDPETFARHCVDPYGPGWRDRFEAALAAAETVHLVRPLHVPPNAASRRLTAQIASGAARLNAERLMTEAQTFGEAETPGTGGEPGSTPVALLSISVGRPDEEGFADRLGELKRVLASAAAAPIPPHLSGDEVLAGFGAVDEAAAVVRNIQIHFRGQVPLRIAGHYGFVDVVRDPFLDCLRPSRSGTAILKAIAQATPPDTACVSLDFAASLAAGSEDARCAHWVGELHAFDGGTAIPLYALRPPGSDD